MDLSILSSFVRGSEASYSEKQRSLLSTFRGLLAELQIDLSIDVDRYIAGWVGPVALDIEHDEDGGMVGIGLCYKNKCAYYTVITADLRFRLMTGDLICHNGLSDFDCLRSWGINVRDEQLVHDSMLFGHIIDSSLKSYGLKDMAKRELGVLYPSYDDIVGKRTAKQSTARLTLDKQPVELVAMYNACDTFVTYQLYLKQRLQCGL